VAPAWVRPPSSRCRDSRRPRAHRGMALAEAPSGTLLRSLSLADWDPAAAPVAAPPAPRPAPSAPSGPLAGEQSSVSDHCSLLPTVGGRRVRCSGAMYLLWGEAGLPSLLVLGVLSVVVQCGPLALGLAAPSLCVVAMQLPCPCGWWLGPCCCPPMAAAASGWDPAAPPAPQVVGAATGWDAPLTKPCWMGARRSAISACSAAALRPLAWVFIVPEEGCLAVCSRRSVH